MSAGVGQVTTVVTSIIPVLAVLFPLAGTLPVYIAGRKSEEVRDVLVLAITLVTFGLVVSMYPIVSASSIEYTVPSFFHGLHFYVDDTSLLIAVITSFLWFIAMLYSVGSGYMSHEHAKNRFYTFLLLTLSANMGVLLTGDLLSLFIFLEVMLLTSYVLIIHEETPEAMRAGKKYLFMCIIGGLSLLMGIVLLYYFTGTLMISPLMGVMSGLGWLKYLIALLMIAGFGLKAGIVPLHVWLPEAHPVAPCPASALLSGLMIKAGAYGMLRTVGMIFTPAKAVMVYASGQVSSIWSATQAIGYGVIWIGIVTMFAGVCLALVQENSKRMLAYHSVSQMGYIVLGIGCAAYLGSDGAMGFAGGLYHIVNHALFKALLFLTIGTVYYRTREQNMYQLGGLWRNMPITAMCCFIAVMGISGIPGFNGYASKVLLHHSLVEAYELHGDILLFLGEIIFKIVAVGTLASTLKMFMFTFLGRRSEKYKNVVPVPRSMQVAMLAVAAVIILVGIRPDLLMQMFIIPAMGVDTYSASSVEYLAKYGYGAAMFFTLPNVMDVGVTMLLAGVVFIVGIRAGWFHVHPPLWICPSYWYERIAAGFVRFCRNPGLMLVIGGDRIFIQILRWLIWTGKFTSAITPHGVDRLSKVIEKASKYADTRMAGIERGEIAVDVKSMDFAMIILAVMLLAYLANIALVHLPQVT